MREDDDDDDGGDGGCDGATRRLLNLDDVSRARGSGAAREELGRRVSRRRETLRVFFFASSF